MPPTPTQTAADRKRKKKAKKTSAALIDRFKKAHARGVMAIKAHNYKGMIAAINEESELIAAQQALVEDHQRAAAALSRKIANHLKTTAAKGKKG